MRKRKAIPASVRARVKAKTNNRCGYCGDDHPRLQMDHVVSIESGGADDESNLMAACPSCNNYKTYGDPETLKLWLKRWAQSVCRHENAGRLALASGVIKIDGEPEFYFEKLAKESVK